MGLAPKRRARLSLGHGRVRRFGASPIFSTLAVLYVTFSLGGLNAVTLGQDESLHLRNPLAIAVDRESSHAFIVERDSARLLRWAANELEVLVTDLKATPGGLQRVLSVTFRDGDKVTVLGTSGDELRFATYETALVGPVTFKETLSGSVRLDQEAQVTAFTSTDVALYVAMETEAGAQLVRLQPLRAKVETAKPVYSGPGETITAMAVNQQGHLIAAVKSNEPPVQLRFHHAATGRPLTRVPSDASEITSLAFSEAGLLYGTATKDDRQGIYRFDAYLDDGRQKSRAIEVAAIEHAVGLACASQQVGMILADGEKNARVVEIRLK